MDELPSMSLSYAASGQMEGGQRVYVRDEHYAWLPAQVVSTDETNFTCQVEIALPRDWTDSTLLMPASPLTKEDVNVKKRVVSIDLQEYPNGELPLQNLESRESSSLQLMNKPDMADLPFLHEAAILYNLKDRHYRGVPYTRVGDIVVAMNPFRWIEGLYSSEKQDFYAQHLIWNGTHPNYLLPYFYIVLL
jgi:myosin-5